ncbi:MAG: recombination mediator RecR [Candidatus Saccharimonadales bacterium]
MLPKPLELLVSELNKLPGVGPRTAERLAMSILRRGAGEASQLSEALTSLHANIVECSQCHNLASEPLCFVCSDPKRSRDVVAIVEDALDVVALERAASFDGVYHVLGGIISPVDGIGPDQLNLASLKRRVEGGGIEELILATNASVEGEATAHYIRRFLPDIKITRLARGLPMGSDLEYADQTTLVRALEGRQTV